MCYQCYEKLGSPKVFTERTEALVSALRELFDEHCEGGLLHVVVSEWNLEDSLIKWCLNECETNADRNERFAILSRQAGELLLTYSEAERATALAVAERLIDWHGNKLYSN